MANSTELQSDTLRALRTTRQVREFTGAPITDEQLHDLLEVARWSGSAINRQPWTFAVVRDRADLDQLAGLAPMARGVPSSAVTIAIGMRPGDKPDWDPFDEGRASERMLIAATALGLGASVAWVAQEHRRKVAELLGLPEPVYVRTLVSVGHPSDAALRPKSAPGEARKPLSEVVSGSAKT